MKKKVILYKQIILASLLVSAVFLSACDQQSTMGVEDNFQFVSYPMETDAHLTYFMATNTNLTSFCENFGDTEIAKALAEKTGVQVEYIQPAAGQEQQTLALYSASGELPDIVEYNWYNYTGGPSKALDEGLIIPLNEMMDNGDMPNLKKYLDENPDIDRSIKTDDRLYYVFPFIRGSEKLLVSTGPIIRKDWLDDLGLDFPQTIEDMENILTKFKEEKGASAPLSTQYLNHIIVFAGGYSNFYVKDGTTVCYGPLDKSYKEAVTTLHRWYEKGLLDNDFVSIDSQTLDSNMLNGKTGVTFGSGGGGLGKWLEAMTDVDSSYDLAGFSLPYASMIGNIDTPYYGLGSVAISSKCQNPRLAARYLDYGYSEEGHMLYNFGIEGISYNMVDGEPVYTEEITNNPDGLTMAQAMLKYFRASNVGPFIQDQKYIEQYYSKPQQQEALNAWMERIDIEQPMVYPKAILTSEENDEYSTIMTEVTSMVNEKTTQFIIGTLPMEEYDSFISDLKALNVDKAIALRQAALERYNQR